MQPSETSLCCDKFHYCNQRLASLLVLLFLNHCEWSLLLQGGFLKCWLLVNSLSVTYPRTFVEGTYLSKCERPFESEVPFSSVQLLSRVQLFATPGIAARQASLSITNSRSSLKLMSIESVLPSNHLILCRPLLLLPLIPPSIRVFSSESALRMRWPKYWSFSFSIIQDWSPLGWTGWISLQSKGLSRVFSNTTVQSINSSVLTFLDSPTLTSIHDYWKNHSLD